MFPLWIKLAMGELISNIHPQSLFVRAIILTKQSRKFLRIEVKVEDLVMKC
jgi:hypothetical protein